MLQVLSAMIKKGYIGFMLSMHIDTRAVELMGAILAVFTGIILTVTPNVVHLFSFPTIYWGWTYSVFGIISCISSIYGPYRLRKALSLVGVYLWIYLVVWLYHGSLNDSLLDHKDDLLLACLPYSFFVISSFFTYLGLWRNNSKWNYYHEPPRDFK